MASRSSTYVKSLASGKITENQPRHPTSRAVINLPIRDLPKVHVMHIDQLIEQAKLHSNDPQAHPSVTVTSDWTQGRTLYGGISAALVYAAVKERVAADRVMRSFTCNFIGPLNADSPFRIDVEVLREGKNASQVIAKAIQDDKVAVLCQVCFGVGRKSKVAVENTDTHDMALPNKAKFIPQIPKITPKFLRHFDLSVDQGKMPFAGSKQSIIHGWMRYTKNSRSLYRCPLNRPY